jgi:hypothetical protein
LRDVFSLSTLQSRRVVIGLVALGVVLRAAQYLANRSLWLDEAFLAINIVEKPLTALARPLDFNQAAPIGFLVAEHITGVLFGFSEYVLRLFPLLVGIASIPAFAWVARRVVSPAIASFALLLFGVADGLIYYASEVKPYAADVATTVGLLALAVVCGRPARPLSRRDALLLGLAGIALIPWSFAAAIVLIAMVIALSARLAVSRSALRSTTTITVSLWALAACAIVVLGLTRSHDVRESFGGGSGRFLGISGSSSPFHAVDVLGTRIAEGLGFSLEQPFSQVLKLAALLVVVGGISLFRRNPLQATILILPFVLVLGASATRFYPIAERTVLFLIPPVILLLAEGIDRLVAWTPTKTKTLVGVGLMLAICAGPLASSSKGLVNPRTHEEIKPVLAYVRKHWRAGDSMYVHYGAQYALLYYEECDCFGQGADDLRHVWPLRPIPRDGGDFPQAAVALTSAVVIGGHFGLRDRRYVRDLDRVMDHKRVWFLYSHLSYDGEESFIKHKLLTRLRSWGDRVAGIDEPGAHAYLYRAKTD